MVTAVHARVCYQRSLYLASAMVALMRALGGVLYSNALDAKADHTVHYPYSIWNLISPLIFPPLALWHLFHKIIIVGFNEENVFGGGRNGVSKPHRNTTLRKAIEKVSAPATQNNRGKHRTKLYNEGKWKKECWSSPKHPDNSMTTKAKRQNNTCQCDPRTTPMYSYGYMLAASHTNE